MARKKKEEIVKEKDAAWIRVTTEGGNRVSTNLDCLPIKGGILYRSQSTYSNNDGVTAASQAMVFVPNGTVETGKE